jgi:hypothetical protein
MKILLDECVPIQVRDALRDHNVHSASAPEWRGLTNGELLIRAEQEGFDLLVIADKNMRYQQDLSKRRIAILELWTNHPPTLEQHSKRIRSAVSRIAPGELVQLSEP